MRIRYYNENLQKAQRWNELRTDWVSAIDNSDSGILQDLKDLISSIGECRGVTTSLAGSWSWYSDRRNTPFDLVIIDEISKATPPEIVLALLLGRRIVLVGDHKQLPPHFDDPRKSNRDDMESDEEDEYYRFEKLATTALLEQLFKDADDSLKSTLTIQYRMHRSIMHAVNPHFMKINFEAD